MLRRFEIRKILGERQSDKKTQFQLCWSLGGYLAEIESQEHENLLDTFLIDGVIYWIGLSDFSVEGKQE